MKVIIFIAILVSLSMFAFAQSPAEDAIWTSYQDPAAEFSIDFPSLNVTEAYKHDKDEFSALYKMKYENFYFFMFIDDDESSSIYQDIKNYASAYEASVKDVSVGEVRGKRYDFKTDDGYEHSFVAIGGKSYFYVFQVTAETRDQITFDKFLNSIKITTLKEKIARDRSNIFKRRSSTPPPTWAEEPGVMSSMSTPVPPKYTKVTSGVAIMSKPKPPYTDLARRYDISGTVRLRVTFEKDGKLGEIKPMSKLPFGLTGNAIRAARRITFVPATREGDPYAVSKMIEYNFTIY